MHTFRMDPLMTVTKQGRVLALAGVALGFGIMRLFPLYDTSVSGVCMLSNSGVLGIFLVGRGFGIFVGTLSLVHALRHVHRRHP